MALHTAVGSRGLVPDHLTILELAVDSGYLLANPARGLKVLGGQEREMLHLGAAQVRDLIDAAEELRPGAGLLVQILAYGGLR